KGVPLSSENRRKLSEAQTGRTVSEQTRQKISESLRSSEKYAAGRKKAATAISRPIKAYNPQTGETREYPAVASVSLDGFSPSNVGSCCNGKRKTCGRLVWSFA